MTQYSFFNLIKREAKAYGRSQGISLAMAQEHVARESGFAHFHEMVAVSKSNPSDQRLMMRAIGLKNFDEILFEDSIWRRLDSLVEDDLSGPIAETNAVGFIIENLEVSSAEYDESSGIATLEVYFEYQGEQDEDLVWHGAGFYVDAQIRIIYRDGWSLVEDEPLFISDFKTDQDLDHESELDSQYDQDQSSLKSKDKSAEDPFEF